MTVPPGRTASLAIGSLLAGEAARDARLRFRGLQRLPVCLS